MKKFLAMLMTATMVSGIVPSTAFATNDPIASMKTVGEFEWNVEEAKTSPKINGVELQVKLKDFYQSFKSTNEEFELFVDVEGGYAINGKANEAEDQKMAPVELTDGSAVYRNGTKVGKVFVKPYGAEETSFDFIIQEDGYNFTEDDKIVIVFNDFEMNRYGKGASLTADVTGDFGEAYGLPIATVFGNTLTLDYTSKLMEIPEEGIEKLKPVTIKSKVGNFKSTDEVKVKINSDFEIAKIGTITGGSVKENSAKEQEFVIIADGTSKEIKISDMEIEVLDKTKPNKIAVITTTCKGYDSAAIEVAKVIADEVKMSVDTDEDIPVMYSGVDKKDTGLSTSDSHDALTVTIEETAKDSWNTKYAWTLSLPDGVYVTGDSEFAVEHIDFTDGKTIDDMFKAAYEKGDFEEFDFGRHSFVSTPDEKSKIEFTLNLVAEPDFEGDVDLTLETEDGTQTVTIAKFIKPYKVTASQNDVNIDHRYTKLNSDIVIAETEADLWKDGTEFKFDVDHMEFEDTTKYSSNFDIKEIKNVLGFKVEEESDNEPFKVTINDMSLFMDRNLPAGGYDLMLNTTMSDSFMKETLLGTTDTIADVHYDKDVYNEVIKKAFVNVITGSKDKFVTKVIVPIGKDYIYSGEKMINIDTPAYINKDNYTMLPVRAVANALGISNENVRWDNDTDTVTIIYGNRIISMVVGTKEMKVNGSTIPTSTAVEVVNGRTFIPMRDLAAALGVKDMTWDSVNKVAQFN